MSDPARIHLLFDIAAWLMGLAAGFSVYRWRLTDVVAHTAARTTPGYFIALGAGGILGAFVLGTVNLYFSGQPRVGRSILGALFGAIVAVEPSFQRKLESSAFDMSFERSGLCSVGRNLSPNTLKGTSTLKGINTHRAREPESGIQA